MSAPGMTHNDLLAFHAAHFSPTSSAHFAENFLGPADESYTEEFEDDGLGYYSDGVKRTLTDEQIAIFRHSEIQALLRKRRHKEEAYTTDDAERQVGGDGRVLKTFEDSDAEDGEVPEEFSYAEPIGPIRPSTKKKSNKSNRKAKKAQEAREKGWFKQNIKPDLRKRTWDKVEKSVATLTYDDEDGIANQGSSSAPQRRKITYDDP